MEVSPCCCPEVQSSSLSPSESGSCTPKLGVEASKSPMVAGAKKSYVAPALRRREAGSSPSVSLSLGAEDSSDLEAALDSNDSSSTANEVALHVLEDLPQRAAPQVLDDLPPTADKKNDQPPPARAPWVRLFNNNQRPENGIQLQGVPVEGNCFVLSDKDELDMDNTLGFCLLGYFSGRFPGKKALDDLCATWKVGCTHLIHDSGWIILKFESDADRLRVLEGGPYTKFGRQLHLKMIPKDFTFDPKEMSIVPVWIKLLNWPVNYWTRSAFCGVASHIGTPICSDEMTNKMMRLSYARLLVHVDASKPLVEEVKVVFPSGKVVMQKIVYEHRPKYCTFCNTLSHLLANCQSIKDHEDGALKDNGNNGGGDKRATFSEEKPSNPKGKGIGSLAKGKATQASVNLSVKPTGTHKYLEETLDDDGADLAMDLHLVADAVIGATFHVGECSKDVDGTLISAPTSPRGQISRLPPTDLLETSSSDRVEDDRYDGFTKVSYKKNKKTRKVTPFPSKMREGIIGPFEAKSKMVVTAGGATFGGNGARRGISLPKPR